MGEGVGRRSACLALADTGEFVEIADKAVKRRALKDVLVGCLPRLQAKAARDRVIDAVVRPPSSATVAGLRAAAALKAAAVCSVVSMVNPVQSLSFPCWNVQGLDDDDKCGLVRDDVVTAAPSVACLQESKLASLDGGKPCSFLPVSLSEFVTKDADGSREGIVTARDLRLLSLVSVIRSRFSLSTSLMSTVSDIAFTITNVYAPVDHSLTSEFVDDMLALAPSMTGAWLVIGDFNLICLPREKNNDSWSSYPFPPPRKQEEEDDTIHTLLEAQPGPSGTDGGRSARPNADWTSSSLLTINYLCRGTPLCRLLPRPHSPPPPPPPPPPQPPCESISREGEMADALDMSLDDLISKNKSSSQRGRGRRNQASGSGSGSGSGSAPGGPAPAGRRFQARAATRAAAAPYHQFNFQHQPPPAALAYAAQQAHAYAHAQTMALVAPPSGVETGTKLYISNLDYNVSNEDIKELFAEVGDLKRYSINYDKSGRSKGTAEVIFSRKSDALAALKRYNNVQLDGKPMKIEVIGTNIEAPPAPAIFTLNTPTIGNFNIPSYRQQLPLAVKVDVEGVVIVVEDGLGAEVDSAGVVLLGVVEDEVMLVVGEGGEGVAASQFLPMI
ncbi:THO complex subunit 4-A [Hordeum vulgare]|nr:THO complex subunit 4-A [Hordeum vulgare]